jgi:hypothetical protein
VVKTDAANNATIYAGVFAVNFAPVPTAGTRAMSELKDRFSSKECLSFVVFKKR